MKKTASADLARKIVNTIKFLAVDAIEAARSGHPGLPMGAADVVFVLWSRYLRYDPAAPDWPDRDRFVLSAGHGSALLYALLHLAGYDLPMAELKAFRQWGSRTPGHPEFGLTPGVEATTGPLGQGVGNAVGMSLASRMLAARFNDGESDPVTHRVFTLASDGDLMEGVSGEASSLAGHLKLGNLVILYDDNRITIEGKTSLAFSEDVALRYRAYGWHVTHADGHDHASIAAALGESLAETERPSLIVCRTHLAHGSPGKQDSASAHGSPLGPEEVRATKEKADWPPEPAFLVPDDVRAFFRARAEEGAALRTGWENRFARWREAHPDRAELWDRLVTPAAPGAILDALMEAAPKDAAATRAHGGKVLQKAAELLPGLVGGSADLAPSTKTRIQSSPNVGPGEFAGRNLHFGVREHGMGAILNGMAYHGFLRPYGSTFLVFSDYMRPAVRVAALAHLPVIYVFTHDSIFVGEDGPTHQPVEHAAALRVIPNLDVFRPADGLETALAWGMALERTDGPAALLLTRQKVPPLERTASGETADPRRGAYRVSGEGRPDLLLAASGSEVHLAVAAAAELRRDGRNVHVISVPCFEVLERQGADYRAELFPERVPRVFIEAGVTETWRALLGPKVLALGVERFGASAPAGRIAEEYGFTPEAVLSRIRDWLA